jgi:hypothetical protein
VRQFSDLNKDNVCRILRAHFKEENLAVVDLGDLKRMDGVNDYFQSEIKKVSVKVKREDGGEEDVDMIIKAAPGGIVRHFQKVSVAFLFQQHTSYGLVSSKNNFLYLNRLCGPSLVKLYSTVQWSQCWLIIIPL